MEKYEVIEILQPSGSQTLRIALENGEVKNIHIAFFRHMQLPSFQSDMDEMMKDSDAAHDS